LFLPSDEEALPLAIDRWVAADSKILRRVLAPVAVAIDLACEPSFLSRLTMPACHHSRAPRTERRAKHGRLAEEDQNKLSRVRGGATGWSVIVAVCRVRSVVEGAAEAEPQASNSLEFDDELLVLDPVSACHAISILYIGFELHWRWPQQGERPAAA
jgi:hypothetical protein